MRLKSPANSILRLLFPWHGFHSVEQVAGEVARQCRASLLRRVYQRTVNMSVAEIRGYVRAQAAGYVGDEVDQVLCRRRLKPALRNRVADAAINQLVGMIAHDVLSGEPSASTRPLAA